MYARLYPDHFHLDAFLPVIREAFSSSAFQCMLDRDQRKDRLGLKVSIQTGVL